MEKFFDKNFRLESISTLKFIIDRYLKMVDSGTYSIDDMIIVFDIDDTLITVNLSDDYRIAIAEAFYRKGNIFNEHELENLDYAILEDKVPCEGSKTLDILDYINDNNINSIVITSRKLHLSNATIYNLSKNGILDRITKNKFFCHTDDKLDAGLDVNSQYSHNVLLVSDQSKGDVFSKFLKGIGRSFKIIIIVDNTLDKINSFYQPFDGESNIIGLLYTRIDPE